jgi:hypothetical protein
MKKLLLLFALIGCVTWSNAKGQRVKYNFNSDWEIYVGDVSLQQVMGASAKSWKRVTLPHAFNEDEAFRVQIYEHTDTVVWYRKSFRLPRNVAGNKIFLEFEGIRFGGEFFVNGKSVGIHENGVMAFGFDITDYIDYGKVNVISARIDNSWKYKERATGSGYQWNDKNFNANYGGIPKNVYLHVAPRLYQTLPLFSNLKTTGTYVYAREMDVTKRRAMVFAESEVRNEFPVAKEFSMEMSVEDADGRIVKTISSGILQLAAGETTTVKVGTRVEDMHFWSWGYGYLYNVYTVLKVDGKPIDVVKTRTGFRKTRFADGKVWLNDRVIQIKGYAERTSNEWPAVGLSVPAWLSDFSNKMMVESNANTVRWMHVTPWKQDVESCDRVGLMQLMPAGDAEKDVSDRRWGQRVELMRDAIIYNRNNPSVVFYESGNESISEEHMEEMKAVRDRYDPYGGRAIGSREMLDSKVAEYGGEMLYINKSAHIPMFATEYCRDEALRKYWDDYSFPFHQDGEGSKYYRSTVTNTSKPLADASAYNRNQDSFFKELIIRWNDYYRVRPGTGDRVSSGGLKIHFHDSNTHFRGAENYRRSGVTDAMRIPKDGFFAHQVMWDGWVDTEKERTYICGHWNYSDTIVKPVYVVSTADKVELFVNGRSLGWGTRSDHFLFTFPRVKWEKGVVEAVGCNEKGEVLSRSSKETAGEAAMIRLKAITAPDGFKADGADMALIEVEVTDNEGRRCPLANQTIRFELQGEAEWLGGIAKGEEGNYVLSQELPVECGVNRVLIRSTKKTGKIRLVASAEGLTGADVNLQTSAFETKNGLSAYISGEHLPVNLSRGETPKGDSFRMSRRAVKIVGATAGCNEGLVRNSFDDNELSEWGNDGRKQTAWIKYELEEDALLNEVELKLTGWRMRSYPIRIWMDDELVYEGETPKSLGYITLPLKPVKGRFVKIELTGMNNEQDAFGGIIEVTGKKELDLFKDPNATDSKGQLRIVEVEFYKSL